jgi:3-hydroxybutyryl-CoA dehydratase
LNYSKNSTSKLRDIYVGMKINHVKTITEADIVLFAGVSGDFNPVHVCEEYAKKTLFKGRIAHGMLALALISAAVVKLPGLVIYLSQTANFLKPIRIGDSITASIEVISKDDIKGILRVRTICVNQNNETAVEGEAKIRIYEPPGD